MKILRKTFTPLLFILLSTSLPAQINTTSQWTWVKGDNSADQPGVYGTQGTADAANKPGARVYSFSWQDALGNFWLFGGAGYAETGIGELSDLWKYNLVANTWTWIHGAKTINQPGVYGTLNTPDVNNRPGGRDLSVSWVDNAGNVYVFGGRGYDVNGSRGVLNDLWKYNPATNEWTWIKGSNLSDQHGVYGSQGVAAAGNVPGARFESAGYTDAAGNFWLLGGVGYDATGLGYLNDLWKYNPTLNEWTWMKGDAIIDQNGVYGVQGIANPANKPGSRGTGQSWSDASGNLWFFGGQGRSVETAGGTGFFNDLWKYNIATNQWTWMKGDNTVNVPGVYGTQGTAEAANKPGARFASNGWVDAAGDLWLFGGGYGNAAINLQDYFNDLWKYNPTTNQWVWVKGNNTFNEPAIYGTQGTASALNRPGAKYGVSGWQDAVGNFWVFGGLGFDASGLDFLNDLWKLGSGNPLPLTLLTISAQVIQNKVQVNWQTVQESNTSYFIIERSADGRSFSLAASITAAGNSSTTKNYSFTDQQLLQGARYYRVKMIDKDGSFKYSPVVIATADGPKKSITVFPNPVITTTTINITTQAHAQLKFSLYDYKGSLVMDRKISMVPGNNSFSVDMSKLSKGVYKALLMWQNEIKNVNIVKE